MAAFLRSLIFARLTVRISKLMFPASQKIMKKNKRYSYFADFVTCGKKIANKLW